MRGCKDFQRETLSRMAGNALASFRSEASAAAPTPKLNRLKKCLRVI
jgi:hypothetical protein